MWKCPDCKKPLINVLYNASTSGYESGKATLFDKNEPSDNNYDMIDDWDCRDSGWNDTYDYEYECPECNHNISLSDLIWIDIKEEKEKEETLEELNHKIIKPQEEIMETNLPDDFKETTIICKNCNYLFTYDDEDESSECPKCGKTTLLSKYLENNDKPSS